MVHFVGLAKLRLRQLLYVEFWLTRSSGSTVSQRTSGPQFMARFWGEFCCLLGITISLSSGCHPQSNGQSEQLNQEIGPSCPVIG